MRRWTFVALAACVAALPAIAECDKDCDSPTAWTNFTAVTWGLTDSGSGSSAKYSGTFDLETLDFLIDIDARSGKETTQGRIGMVAGRIMLSKGMSLPTGSEIDAVDAPVLVLRLVQIVLGRVFPKGPSAVGSSAKFDYAGKSGIRFATPSASGRIELPWRAVGEGRKSESGQIAVDMVITAPKSGLDAMHVTATFGFRSRPVFDEEMPLADWKVYGVGPQVESRGGATVIDYGAKPKADSGAHKVSDLRALIAAENDPGVNDASKDFTGFWKGRCEDAFGQSIARREDGKYAIVFCGPGGCGDPSEARPTFITGDKHYEVVSEDEIIEVFRGSRDRMIRCTRDTHPVLKH